MKEALLVIDYSNDFIADDGKLTAGAAGQSVEDALCEKIVNFVERGELVVFSMDYHLENDSFHPESKLFPEHNIVGTKGRELYGKVNDLYQKIKDRDNVIWLDKFRYSAFYGTILDALLRSRGIKKVVLTGVCTDICVLHTAVDAYNLSYDIEIPVSCVASFNQAGHEFALQHFTDSLGAELTN